MRRGEAALAGARDVGHSTQVIGQPQRLQGGYAPPAAGYICGDNAACPPAVPGGDGWIVYPERDRYGI